MRTDNREIERRMEHFEEVCRSAGVKITHQRMEIFRHVAESGRHPDARAVLRGVRERIPTISLDTVYRTLWMLADLGLITRLGPPRDRARFDANLSRHHHFVCRLCGLIRDFYSDALDTVQLPEVVDSIGLVETTRVSAEGVCRACSSHNDDTSSTTPNDRRTS